MNIAVSLSIFLHDECDFILSIQCNQLDVLVEPLFLYYLVCQIMMPSLSLFCCRLSKFSFENPLRGDKSLFFKFIRF